MAAEVAVDANLVGPSSSEGQLHGTEEASLHGMAVDTKRNWPRYRRQFLLLTRLVVASSEKMLASVSFR